MTLSDLEWLSEIFSDTKHRAVSLRQLNVLFYCQWVAWMYCVRVQCWMASSRVDSIHFPSRTRKVCRSVAAPRRWKRCSFISLVNEIDWWRQRPDFIETGAWSGNTSVVKNARVSKSRACDNVYYVFITFIVLKYKIHLKVKINKTIWENR